MLVIGRQSPNCSLQGVINPIRARPLKTFNSQRSICGLGLNQLLRSMHHRPYSLLSQQRRQQCTVQASFNDDWSGSFEPIVILEALTSKLKVVFASMQKALAVLWEKQQEWQRYTFVRVAVGVAAFMALITAAANVWGVPAINRQLPTITQQAAHVLGRDVDIGRVRWVAPSGILGITPLAGLGPVSVGPGPVEKSSATIEKLSVQFSPLDSILQQRLVLNFNARNAEVHLKQCDNYSWFGYPEDTSPASARNFIPGLIKDGDGTVDATTPHQSRRHGKKKNGKGRGGSGGNGGSTGGGGGGATTVSSQATTSNTSNAQPTEEHQESSRQISASTNIQTFLEKIANELITWQEQQEAADLETSFNNNRDDNLDEDREEAFLLLTPDGRQIQLQNMRYNDALYRSVEGPSNDGKDGKKSGSGGSSSSWLSFRPFPGSKSSDSHAENGVHQPGAERAKQIAALNSIEVSAISDRKPKVQLVAKPSPPSTTEHVDEPVAPSSVPDIKQLVVQEETPASTTPSTATPSEEDESITSSSSSHRHAEKTNWLGKIFQPFKPALVESDQTEQHQPQESAPLSVEAKTLTPIEDSSSRINNKLKPIRAASTRLYTATEKPSIPQAPSVVAPSQSIDSYIQDEAAASVEEQQEQVEAAQAASEQPTDETVITEEERQAEKSSLKQEEAEPSATDVLPTEAEEVVAAVEELQVQEEQPTVEEPKPELTEEMLEKQKQAVERINAFSGFTAGIKRVEKQGEPPLETPSVEVAPVPVIPQTPATKSINALHSIDISSTTPRKLAISSSPAVEAFSKTVADPAALRKKRGSKALQAERNWQPVKPAAVGSTQALATDSNEGNAKDLATIVNTEVDSSDDASAPKSDAQVLVGEDVQQADLGNHASTSMKGRKSITHPGYFTATQGPSYTPAPPEALAERRARQRPLLTVTRQALGAALSHVQVAAGGINIQNATLHAYMHGEELPRVFENVSGSVKLGKDYDTLNVTVTAEPHVRDPASMKCTMVSPFAHRHLRDYTGLAATTAWETLGDRADTTESSTVVEPASPSSSSTKKANPQGGRVFVSVKASGVVHSDLATNGPRFPDLTVVVKGTDLHAPLIERIVELPMDINAGRANGEFIIKSHDAASWNYPEFYGRVAVRGAEFHFWDATDDILDANLDLVFEKDRLYLHNTTGRFGSVPMTLTGDLDLDPLTGHYRLSATVPGVEVNQLRATLGVRPTPFPVAGAVGGTLHVTGPLEEPVFSGTAHVIRPTREMFADCEPTAALTTLLNEPSAVGAYDRIPVAAATVVFELNTATDQMTLHSIRATPVGGGVVQGAGTMWVAPEAEQDPSAVAVEAKGSGLPAESIVRQYLPAGTKLPPGIATMGRADVEFEMKGSHLSPVIDVAVKLPEASAHGTAHFTRDSTSVDFKSAFADATGTAFFNPPSFELIKEAITQKQATALAKPNVSGCDADVTLRGVDVMPLISTDEAAMRQLAQQSGQPVRLRVNGFAKISGKVKQPAAEDGAATAPWLFEGDLGLEEVRLNQLKLFKKLKGGMKLSDTALSIHGRGLRPDETLNVNLSLPLLPSVDSQTSASPETPSVEESAEGLDVVSAEQQQRADEDADSIESGIEAMATEDRATPSGGSALSLRCGQLLVAADVNAKGSRLDVRVANLRLDELELASLRGEVQDVSCSLNFEAQTGRGKLSLLGPRYSGLSGESLSGGFRWEKDVVRLEKFVLQQKLSKYEVQGEYVVPPTMPLPTSAADLARQRQQPPTSGRWRLRVDVPAADMQEILPAARLLQDVTSHGPSDYERAKTGFIEAVKDLGARAQELNAQLGSLMEQVVAAAEGGKSNGPSNTSVAATSSASSGNAGSNNNLQLPSVRDVKGQWAGSVQAFGGGGGATSCEFDIKGQGWQWGSLVGLETVVANGSYHSEEGVQLQEFVLKSGDAKLLLRGSLLSDQQDASILVTDFPVSTLRPIFRAVPALQHVAPAVGPQDASPVPSPRPLGMLANTLNNALAGASKGFQEGVETDSPINGLLYVSGNLGGSKEQPTGEVAVRLYDGAVGEIRLAQAQASARLSDNMLLSFNVDVVPAEGHRHSGHVRAGGIIPLAGDASSTPNPALSSTDQSNSGTSSVKAATTQPMDVRVSVRDSGMAILTSVTPDFRWQSGEADVAVRLSGTVDKPTVTGAAALAKATIDCPFLKYPLTITSAEARCEEGLLTLETFEAKVGRKGQIRARGVLPVYQIRIPKNRPAFDATTDSSTLQQQQNRLTVDVQGLELRLRNMYSGQYDALLTVRDSMERPLIGGSMRFSRGTIFVVPQNAPDVNTVLGSASGPSAAVAPGPSVARVFELLTKGESGLAQRFEDVVRQEVEAVEHIVEETAGSNVSLDGLALQFGPDLRAIYPLVMNFSLAGELALSGPAHPDQVDVHGTLRLLGGEVNLVATQLELNRDHQNTVTFGGVNAPAGLDPIVDVVFTGGDLRVSITGRASEWAEHLVLQSMNQGGGKVSGDAGEQLDAAEAARLFESKLKAALLADDGQLALSRLAGTTVSTLMPKIETQGQVGGAKWRLVSAPAIPGLLDPTLADPSNLLSSITMGTEVEVQFGRKLQAAMVRKLRESDVTTQWTLNYNLNSKLRMQFNISSAAPYQKSLMFQYSDSGTT